MAQTMHRPDPARGAALDFAGLGIALLLFCSLALWHLGLPGLYQDEALDVAPAVRLLRGYAPWPYALFPGTLALPLMVCDHVGPTSTYLMLPFLWAFGINLTAVRLYEFAVGLGALVTIFFWAQRVLLPGAAGIAVLLLTAMPSFWLACRNGLHVSFIVVPLAAGALVCLDRWHRQGRRLWLYAGALLLGTGLSSKLLFLWFLAALLIGVWLAQPRVLRALGRRELMIGGIWFATGCLPFLLFLLLSRGLTLRTILASLTQTPYGVRNAAFLTNLATQLRSFASTLDGGWLTWAGASPRNALALPLFLAAAVSLIALGRGPVPRRLIFCLISIAVIVLASCFTISTLGPKHLVILLPFPTLIVAGALSKAWSERSRPASAVLFLVLSALAAAQLAWDLSNARQYHRSLAATGGTGLFSSAHDQLARYLVAHRVRQPLAGDWGFDSNLEVLSQGRARVRRIFELLEPPPYAFTREQARAALRDPASMFLFHEPRISATPGRFQAVAAVAEQAGAPLARVATFRDGLRRPVIYVYRSVSHGPRGGDWTQVSGAQSRRAAVESR